MPPEDITLTDVTKIFRLGVWKKKIGVHELTLGVPRGQVVGLLGPNGSGKSTTLKMILGFLTPTRGEISVCGIPSRSRAARQHIGYLPENPRFQKFLTAFDLMHYYGHLHGLRGQELNKRADELLELVNLKHAARERVQGYSKGMTQRLALAQALVNRPRLLIFDEPMSGLDPLGRMEIRALIQRIHQEMPESTIFFSTHILADVEELCDAVALLRKGKLVTFSGIEELMKAESSFNVVARGIPTAMEKKLKDEKRAKPSPLGLVVDLNGTGELVDYLDELKRMGATVVSIASPRTNLEKALFSEKGIAV